MDKIMYKDADRIITWMDAALEMEWQKFEVTPVKPDMLPGFELAAGWGYVVAGYFLMEQGLKAVLNFRDIDPPKTHVLSCLFNKLHVRDRKVLKAYYDDFYHTFTGMSSYPFATLEGFLENLDGGRNNFGRLTGSFDWRYFLTEVGSGTSMPIVSINVMHEFVYGCVRLVESIWKNDAEADRATYSWRLQWERCELHIRWLSDRMNSPGWGQEGDRVEILWGPGYDDRYDCLEFKDDSYLWHFAPLPNAEETKISMVDKRQELESFDPEKGFWSHGTAISKPARRHEPEPRHVMY